MSKPTTKRKTKKIKCPDCLKTYTKYYFHRHLCKKYHQQPDRTCKICNKEFKYKCWKDRHEKNCIGALNDYSNIHIDVKKLKKIPDVKKQYDYEDNNKLVKDYEDKLNKLIETIVCHPKNCNVKWDHSTYLNKDYVEAVCLKDDNTRYYKEVAKVTILELYKDAVIKACGDINWIILQDYLQGYTELNVKYWTDEVVKLERLIDRHLKKRRCRGLRR